MRSRTNTLMPAMAVLTIVGIIGVGMILEARDHGISWSAIVAAHAGAATAGADLDGPSGPADVAFVWSNAGSTPQGVAVATALPPTGTAAVAADVQKGQGEVVPRLDEPFVDSVEPGTGVGGPAAGAEVPEVVDTLSLPSIDSQTPPRDTPRDFSAPPGSSAVLLLVAAMEEGVATLASGEEHAVVKKSGDELAASALRPLSGVTLSPGGDESENQVEHEV